MCACVSSAQRKSTTDSGIPRMLLKGLPLQRGLPSGERQFPVSIQRFWSLLKSHSMRCGCVSSPVNWTTTFQFKCTLVPVARIYMYNFSYIIQCETGNTSPLPVVQEYKQNNVINKIQSYLLESSLHYFSTWSFPVKEKTTSVDLTFPVSLL